MAVIGACVSSSSQPVPKPARTLPTVADKPALSEVEGNVRPTKAAGSVENGTYRNQLFGFHYKIPFGWVERTEEMREGSSGNVGAAAPGRVNNGNAEDADQGGRATQVGKSLLLLAVFERPPEATGDSVNSAVVITAESAEAYPGLKTAADYFSPLSDVATSKGFQVVNEPYYFAVGGKQLVRGDFSKKIGQVTMYQSSLVILVKGYLVSFTFVGGDDDEVSELIEHLEFSPSKKAGNGAH